MVVRRHGWKEYDFRQREDDFLGELRWEVQENPAPPLHGTELRIVGWIPGYDDFNPYLPHRPETVIAIRLLHPAGPGRGSPSRRTGTFSGVPSSVRRSEAGS
jgi:hypothetical protein